MSGSLRNWIKVRFITGFFVTVPAIASAWLLYVFWDALDTFFSPGYERLFGRRIPGLGFLTAVVLVLVMGTIAKVCGLVTVFGALNWAAAGFFDKDVIRLLNMSGATSRVLLLVTALGAMFMLVNLVTDILYGLIDPRVRRQ